MKIINFGSLNMDRVYRVADFVVPGRTIAAKGLETFAGGKGLNQSIASARGGASVLHAGAIGMDGGLLLAALREAGVDVSLIESKEEQPSGHAIIQVSDSGENAIFVHGGANQGLDEAYVRRVLDGATDGDLILVQNETSMVPFIMEESRRRGREVCFNPSPVSPGLSEYPLHCVDRFILNLDEAEAIAGSKEGPEGLLRILLDRYSRAEIVLTLGAEGAMVGRGPERWVEPAFPVLPLDTTAAGDCFAGFYLAAIARGELDPRFRLRIAQKAASICVQRRGASPSIPTLAETLAAL
ncbi:MAG: ribokinase [Rectinemataceae bacterium]